MKIGEVILQMAVNGFSIQIGYKGQEGLKIAIMTQTEDGLILNNVFDAPTQFMFDEAGFEQEMMTRRNIISNAILMRRNADTNTCNHVFAKTTNKKDEEVLVCTKCTHSELLNRDMQGHKIEGGKAQQIVKLNMN